MPDGPPRRAGWFRVLSGTRPGLERFLLAAFPALVVGSVSAWLLGAWWAGVAIGFGLLFLLVRMSRGIGD